MCKARSVSKCVLFGIQFQFSSAKKRSVCKVRQYENASEEEKVNLFNEHSKHTEWKNRARSEKVADKEKAAANQSVTALTVDLQSVLSTPCSNVSSLYYMRKLSVYKFTVYNQVSGDGFCYVWNETRGERGANEIGSMLYMYIKEHMPRETEHSVITSDSTLAQNRNRYVTAMLLYAVQTIASLLMIEQKQCWVSYFLKVTCYSYKLLHEKK